MSSSYVIFGCGNMGTALIQGMRGPNAAWAQDILLKLADIHEEKVTALCKRYKNCQVLHDLKDVNSADIVVIAVKPQDFHKLALDLRKVLRAQTVLVSLCAGISIDDIQATTQHKGFIVRAMSNLAATVGEAATALCANKPLPDDDTKISDIFHCVGTVDWVNESALDAVTALAGSGPAYVCLLIEALIDGGVKVGLTRKLATNLAIQTVKGSAALLKEVKCHPAVLRDQVTTPAGTTIDALFVMEQKGIRAVIMEAVEVATKKSISLREGRSGPKNS